MINTDKSNGVKMAIFVIAVMLVTSIANAQTEHQQAVDTVYLYHKVEKKPLFAGKDLYEKGGFYEYIRENSCKCLFETYGHGIPAAKLIEFIIDIDGSLINAKIIRNVDPLLDAEALRVINSSPKWTPGKHGDKLVKVKYTLPIRAKNIGGCVVPPGWSEECKKCLQEKSMK